METATLMLFEGKVLKKTVVDHGAQGRGKAGNSLLNVSVTFDRFEQAIHLV